MKSPIPRPPDWWLTIRDWIQWPSIAVSLTALVLAAIASVVAYLTRLPLLGQVVFDLLFVLVAGYVVGRILIRGMVSRSEYLKLSEERTNLSEEKQRLLGELDSFAKVNQRAVADLQDRDRQLVELQKKYDQIAMSPEAEAKDVLSHITMTVDAFDPPRSPRVTFLGNAKGTPMGYPLFVRNGRPHQAKIIGYSITVQSQIGPFSQVIKWDAPASQTNHGFPPDLHSVSLLGTTPKPVLGSRPDPITGIPLPADQVIIVVIPVDIQDIAKVETENPPWYAFGEIYLAYGDFKKTLSFSDPTEIYKLSESEWAEARRVFVS